VRHPNRAWDTLVEESDHLFIGSDLGYAALIARLDTKPTKDDWVRYNAWLESRIAF
jgi:hypothetical protein